MTDLPAAEFGKVAEMIAIEGMPEPQTMMTGSGMPYWRVRESADGTHWIEITPMAFNFRLVTTPKSCLNTNTHGWCYKGFDKWAFTVVLLAAWSWDGTEGTEPPGYFKKAF